MSSIRILLKNKETNRYLGRGGSWTDKPEVAMAFLDRTRANDHRVYHRLTNTEVVELAENNAANSQPPTPAPVSPTPKAEEPVTKGRKPKGRVRRPVATNPKKPQGMEEKSPARRVCEGPGNQQTSTSTSTGSQLAVTPTPAEVVTIVEAKLDVGFGNSLFIRGQGDGLSWDKGTPLECRDASAWRWSSRGAKDKIVFKLLLNDQLWAKGEDLVVEAGKKIEVVPSF